MDRIRGSIRKRDPLINTERIIKTMQTTASMDRIFIKGVRARGFTLIEVLIAIALVAAILTSLYGAVFPVLETRERLEADIEKTRQLRRFIDTLTTELHSALFNEANPFTGLTGTRDESLGRAMSSLAFTTLTYPAISSRRPTGDLKAVRYYALEDADRTLSLFKDSWNPYGEETAAAAEMVSVEVIEGIEGFEAEFYNGETWAKAWDAEAEKTLPEAVRVSVVVNDAGTQRKFTTIARPVIR